MPSTDIEIGARFEPRPKSKGNRQPFVVRQLHRPDRQADVVYADDGTRATLAWSTIKRYYKETEHTEVPPQNDQNAYEESGGTAESTLAPPKINTMNTMTKRDTHRRPDPTLEQIEDAPVKCKHGHAMRGVPSNTYISPKGGFICRTCVSNRMKGKAAERKAAKKAAKS